MFIACNICNIFLIDATQHAEQDTEVHHIWTSVKRCRSMQLDIKHSNKSLQTQINKYDFATDYKKDTHCMKWHKKKSSLIAESEWEKCIQQCST